MDRLTNRERTVLQLVSHGQTNEQIGKDLGISPYTVRTHVSNILTKTNTRTRCHAVAQAIRQGQIQ